MCVEIACDADDVERPGGAAEESGIGLRASEDALAFGLQYPGHQFSRKCPMPTAARSPQPETLHDTTPVASAEGRPSPEEIAREAYLIYMANGAQHGRHDEDWYEAERRLSAAASRQSGTTPQQTAAQLEEVDTKDRTPG
jgi:hypothetical protein